ncbi:MAG: glutamyl-tRNA reductase [Chloroflexi bacterium]|nr:glutamyl-tRNA reductase [Chloroflexota bacterium]
MSHILMMGLNHTTAPIQIREQVACKCDELAQILPRLISADSHSALTESVVLSTCNRIEIYAVTDDRVRGEQSLRDFFESRRELISIPLTNSLYAHHDRAAAQHLLGVACGLDSMILGEFEILGQVRAAYEIANQHKTAGAILTALFHRAIHSGKRARAETGIGRGAASVASAAVALAREQIGDLTEKNILVIGSGEMGQRTAQNLRADGVRSLYVVNRTYDHALKIANDLGGTALPFADLDDALIQADVVISATGARHIVLDAATITRAMSTRPNRALCLIDIGLPRDIDPRAREISNVRLFDLDNLNQVAEENRAEREKYIAEVRAIIEHELEEFWNWLLARRAAPTITALRERAEEIRAAELDKALRRLGHLELNERDRNVIAALSASIVSKLLAAPTAHLKERVQSGDGQVYLDTLRELFELSDEHVGAKHSHDSEAQEIAISMRNDLQRKS